MSHTSVRDIALKNAKEVANFLRSCVFGKADGLARFTSLQIQRRTLLSEASDKSDSFTNSLIEEVAAVARKYVCSVATGQRG